MDCDVDDLTSAITPVESETCCDLCLKECTVMAAAAYCLFCQQKLCKHHLSVRMCDSVRQIWLVGSAAAVFGMQVFLNVKMGECQIFTLHDEYTVQDENMHGIKLSGVAETCLNHGVKY